MKVITIRIPEDLLKEIDSLAKELGVDRSDLIRMLLIKSLKDERISKAIEMYINDEISLERAAEIAGIPLSDFILELIKRGIKHKKDEDLKNIINILKSKGLL